MKRSTRVMVCSFVISLAIGSGQAPAYAHHHVHSAVAAEKGEVPAPAGSTQASLTGVSGQGKMKFRVFRTTDHLPDEAVKVLVSAHGGFAVDRRQGKGETYFALPGAGIIQISANLKSTRLLETPAAMKDVNLHNTTIWYGPDGKGYLTFPANKAGRVFTTTLKGKLVHTLHTPTPKDDFDQPTVNNYFYGKGNFAPTDVEQMDGLFYVTTGYSNLDFVLTAKILSTNPFKVLWYDLAFGGKGSQRGQFGTGHGITVPPGEKRIDVSDRPNSEVDRFTRYGHYRSTLELPKGSYPCDIDYLGGFGIVGCLHGPDRSKGAPIYILDGDKVISTIMPKEELGLEKFQHIHNAVLRRIGGKFYIIVQAWNPGDFAILEQVTE
ncbi:hypothetical protein MYX84_09055 [Acidobacteria bacterium AH-259-O06]|nr:hypothetical protein [Acidobacteria bacterium AH-259-O06]